MNRVVLITGAARGIGRAAVELFAADGDSVVLNYLHSQTEAKTLEEKINTHGGHALALRADVRDHAAVQEMVRRAEDAFGKIDVLVNNAGIAQQKLFCDITQTEWDDMMAVHVGGAFHCCQCVLPSMISRKRGKIINISSMWGQVGGSCEVHYSTAKAALIGMTKALAKELGPSNIQVNCVAPGVVDTDMLASFSQSDRAALAEETPLMRLGTPGDVATAVFFLAGSGADFITGQVLAPNGGFVI